MNGLIDAAVTRYRTTLLIMLMVLIAGFVFPPTETATAIDGKFFKFCLCSGKNVITI